MFSYYIKTTSRSIKKLRSIFVCLREKVECFEKGIYIVFIKLLRLSINYLK